ncbi:TPR-like protein [Aureobasidium pullulans]|uniref:TPR-like protein n=1 Tax=Aureobasidium pullulans TaxID=5580 RepID=A0A4S9VKM4_AURPU|nr:TPR-like protein [Aureobasidium pullulans]THZ36832.1 TPR-like protein [Aureobasidium pullulans]THZ52066.1 TPR-like protein [Aureobasidium pullulans]
MPINNMSKVTLSRERYTIGVICALFEEKAAMVMMLDEKHESLEQKSGDNNSYTLGKIGQHNVVIACLPGGHQGKAAAATVAVHMMHSFDIKLGLMVGIGGGVPSRTLDIRLGDVVVSIPEGTHGGVVQYDLGKLELDGLHRKGHLDKPPKALLSAITSLREKHVWMEPEFPQHLTAILSNHRMANRFGFQGAQHDILFESNSFHPRNLNDCDHCVSTFPVVQRADREDDTPRVFYGTILSGDMVMKNGQERDRIAAAENAICFEMEAAGLMNDFPCLVIRGISDYSDSHKNDRWQPYAAATAAAYAKELLIALSKQEVDELGPAEKHHVPFSLKGVPNIDHFVQRSNDMQELERFFFPQQSHDTRRKIFVVHGLGGIGKTQLSIDFVRQYQTKYSAVFWLDGSSKDALQNSFLNTVTRLPAGEVTLSLAHAAKQASPDMKLIVRGVQDWLSLPSNHRWLVVIDNVDRDYTTKGTDPLAYELKEYLPAADHGNVLVTSRLSTLVAARNSHRLTRVDHDQSRAILEAAGGEYISAQDESAADTLLEKLSGLPIALTQAGAYIRQTGVSVAEYMDHYNSTWQQLMEKQDEYCLQEDSERSVLTTWKISYEQVRSRSEGASNLLKLWSFLYADDLWYDLVACSKTLASHVVVPKWLLLLAEDKLEFNRAMGLLIKYSLVESKMETRSFAMHSVLHSWCLHVAQHDSEKGDFRRLASCIVGQADPPVEMVGFWILQRRFLPHAQTIMRFVEDGKNARLSIDEYHAFAQLASIFTGQNKHEEAEKMYDRALAGKEVVLGPDHTSTLDTIFNSGIACLVQGRLAAGEGMLRRALVGQERASGPEHISTLATVRGLGNVYQAQGRLAEAEEMYEKALAGFEFALGPEHPSTLESLNTVGLVFTAQNRLADAEEIYERVLTGYEKIHGPDHTQTLQALNNMGLLYHAQGSPEKAERMFERVLAGFEKTAGPEHASTLYTVLNLGVVFSDQGRLEEAEEMQNRALAGLENAFGSEHLVVSHVHSNLGHFYAKQGRLAEAEPMFERALVGYEKAHGSEHQDTVQAGDLLRQVRHLLNPY